MDTVLTFRNFPWAFFSAVCAAMFLIFGSLFFIIDAQTAPIKKDIAVLQQTRRDDKDQRDRMENDIKDTKKSVQDIYVLLIQHVQGKK